MRRRLKANALDQPILIVKGAEVLKSLNQFRNGAEVADPEQLFLA